VTHYLLAVLFLATSAFATNNKTEAKAAIEEFFKSCSVYPTFKVQMEVTESNLTNSELVSETKKKMKQAWPTRPQLADNELFPHGGDGGFAAGDFESPNQDKDRAEWCEGRLKRLNHQFTIQGVSAKQNTVSMLGYTLQRRMGEQTVLFHAISSPYVDYSELEDLAIEVGNDDSKFGLDEYEVLHSIRTFETDGALRDYLLYDDGKVGVFGRQQLAVARALLMQWSAAGDDLKAGKYLTENATWSLLKVKNPITGEILSAVHFGEYDDNSYTVFFKPSSTKLAYVYYEN